jgi:hypothetical protein
MFFSTLIAGLLSTSAVVPDGDAGWTLQLSTDVTRGQAPLDVDYSRAAAWLELHAGSTSADRSEGAWIAAGTWMTLGVGAVGPVGPEVELEVPGLALLAAGGLAGRVVTWTGAYPASLTLVIGPELQTGGDDWWVEGSRLSLLAGARLLAGYGRALRLGAWYTLAPVVWAQARDDVLVARPEQRVRAFVMVGSLQAGLRAAYAPTDASHGEQPHLSHELRLGAFVGASF